MSEEEELIAQRLKQALQRAIEKLKFMHINLDRKLHAIDALGYAWARLRTVERKPEDMKTRVLLLHVHERAQIEAILNVNPPLEYLFRFGSIPEWMLIEAVFMAAKIECPLELRSFYEAYQEELQTLS